MPWQDYVLTIGSTILTLALIPTIMDRKEKPAMLTSVVSCIILILFSFVYKSLSLKLSSVVIAIHGFLWFVLAVQKYYEKKPRGVKSR